MLLPCSVSGEYPAHANRQQPKASDIITVFQKAGSPASVRIGNLARQVSAQAAATSTLDQASDAQHEQGRDEFSLEVTETLPTEGQIETVLGYVGKSKVQSIINGAVNEQDGLKRFKENKESLILPLVSHDH